MSLAIRRPVIEAAGALVWRVRKGSLEVVLVHRPRYRDWSWPKGKVDPGETVTAAAVREVAEETGLNVALGVVLPMLRYRVTGGRLKHVHYWAAQVLDDDAPALAARPPVVPVDGEIDKVRWLSVDKAMSRLTRRSDRAPLLALTRLYEQDRLHTHAVVVVRHARARRRATWTGSEEDRPLTGAGRRDAKALVPILAAYGISDTVTSLWKRCSSTLAPYAKAAEIALIRAERFTEAEHERSPSRVAATVRVLLESGESSVLCTHRPVLPTVLDVLGQHSPRAVAGSLPTADPFLRPGELLVAHIAQTHKGPRLVGVEVHSPTGQHP